MAVHDTGMYGEDGRLNGSFVYMLLCCDGGPIYTKIGVTDSLSQRLAGLRTGCPLPPKQFAWVEVRSKKRARLIENALHRRMGKWRVNGEWFRFESTDRPAFNEAWKSVFRKYVENGWPLQWSKANVEELAKDAQRRLRAAMGEFGRNREAWLDAQKAGACVRTQS